MQIAERMGRLGMETAFEVLAVVRRLEAEGHHVVSFAIGEPDFDTPQHVKDAAVAALARGETYYTPSPGILPLREAIADYISRTRHISVTPEEVVVTPGAKPIIFFGLLACVNEGDEVIYPNPGFPIYESMIHFVGARPVPAPLVEEKGFRFDLDDLRGRITDRTRMIILNSPGNPCGNVLTPADLEAIGELALRHNLWILSDEVYSRMQYDGEFCSIASLPGLQERTILIDGHSKTYAMTGWRLGYGVMNATLAEHMARLVTNSVSCTATFTQHAGIAALTGPQDEAEAMVQEFRERRDLIVAGLNDIAGVTCQMPHGAFYAYPNVTEACRGLGLPDSRALQEKLLFEGHVAVLARTCFGARNEGETGEYLRLSYATSRDHLREGLRRMKAVMEG
jgi:aspartate/methionine/tyrosine aminotransferase